MLSFLVLFFLGGQPAEFGKDNVFFHGFPIQKPVIRVALGLNLDEVHVHASSGMKIYQVNGNYKLLAEDVSEVRVKGQKENLTEKFVVQVAQAKKRDKAEEEARKLKENINNRIYVAEDKENDLEGIYQVRIGDFLTRGEALDFIKKLGPLGIKEAWILREEVNASKSKPRWVLVNDELINLNEETSLFFIPASPESFLSYGGKNYRGIMLLCGSRKGIVLINILNIEEYLKGVVPGELSPLYFPEIEALKAQAVAARTYALKNIGQFNDLGFDLYATPISQVYDGLSIELPMSTKAVEETRGEVAVYDGKLIYALYTSTCGGATEDFDNMFGGLSAPYLKSTECILEKEEVFPLRSAMILPPFQAAGKNISPSLAYLMALNIIPQVTLTYFKEPAESAETAEWIRKALALLGKKNEKFAPERAILNFTNYVHLLTDAFQWQDRAQNLIGKSETVHVLKNFPALKPEEKNILAYFIISGILPDSPEIADRDRVLTRGEAAYYLYKVMAMYRDFFHQGNVKSLAQNKLEVTEGEEKKQFELSSGLLLLRNIENSVSFTSGLELSGGDVVKWIESDDKIRLLQAQPAPISNVLDATSQYGRWLVRVSREDLEARINQFYPIGKLIDLVPQKRGESKRVIELSIIGQESQVKVTGLKIRQVLNLKDNLFVIDREQDGDGRVTHFIFSGKGWGHGVGLCQIGAYRLAQKGATYDEILKKYYRGIKINKIY